MNNNLQQTENNDIFGESAERVEKIALDAFCDAYKGELFVEYREDEILKIENNIIQSPKFNIKRGFGLRRFKNDEIRYSYSSSMNESAAKKALTAVGSGVNNCEIVCNEKKHNLYKTDCFLNSIKLALKIKFLQDINTYARSQKIEVKQVVAVLASSWQAVSITKDDGEKCVDFRPLIRLTVSIVVEKNGHLESGMFSGGGRFGYENIITEATKKKYVDEAFRQALIKMQAKKAPVGEMPVVLGNGWTGILLHEAIGHGLEGDAIRKKTSSFHNLFGEMIASKNITVVDDGTLSERRGSLNVDDEGMLSRKNVLIENGKLVGFMQDRMNSSLMNCENTGNGRRESYEHPPVPRMTNTFMLSGNNTFDEMIGSVKNGVFAKTFSDGQVDVASGKFVFSTSEAYLIENGKITTPVKGAMLIGDGSSILKQISMIGNDFSLDSGVGTCGKSGQWVPVGVGQPSVLVDKITVGGADF